MSGRVPREMLRKLRKLSGEEGFQDGLREGESEYDDAIIITEDEARDRLTDEGFLRLIGGEG